MLKIRPVVAELFHADRRRYMTKLKVGFRNLAKAPKNAIHKFILSMAQDCQKSY